jgi:hypothetical protein
MLQEGRIRRKVSERRNSDGWLPGWPRLSNMDCDNWPHNSGHCSPWSVPGTGYWAMSVLWVQGPCVVMSLIMSVSQMLQMKILCETLHMKSTFTRLIDWIDCIVYCLVV